jgi:hypothetical protein
MTVTELIKQAAAIVGNETKLADACEVSQNAIWQAKSRGRAHQLLAGIIQRGDGQYQIGLCEDADGLFSSRSFAEDASLGLRSGTSPIERSASLQTSTVNLSMAAATKGDSSVTDPPRAYVADNWTLEDDAFECCCAVCSAQDQ